MSDCLFCKIANHEIDSEIVKESDRVVAFKDINPAAPTHLLIVPKEHITSARELTSGHGDVLAEMFEMMAALADEHETGDYRVVTNAGPEAGQSVFHLHFHLLGGRSLSWPPG